MWLRIFPRIGAPPITVQAGFRTPLFWLAFGNIGSDGSATPPVTPTTGVTTAGGPHRISRATQWYAKTLSELREEEKQRLRKLRKLAKAKIEAAAREGETSEPLLMALGRRVIEQAAPNAAWLTEPVMDAVAAQFLAAYIAAILAELEQDEDDAEAILLLAN